MQKKPEIIVFAGPNGSGKSTVTALANIIEPYINADDIKRSTCCSDIEAAVLADELRNKQIDKLEGFTFEAVLSTERNINLLKKAKEKGFFIRGYYILTSDVNINVLRVMARVNDGGHDVPEEKIRTRYNRAIALIPEFVEICDICHIYDNTDSPYRIFKKRKDKYFFWDNTYWSSEKIHKLTNISNK